MEAEGTLGVVVVDHGSRAAEANASLHDFVALYSAVSGRGIVEAAHMELAEPTIAQAFARCVARGARVVAVCPYFLSAGRHWQSDIPRLAAEAAAAHPGVSYLVAAPLGVHEGLARVLEARLVRCLDAAQGTAPGPCELCAGLPSRCVLRQAPPG